MKRIIAIATVVALLLASCSKDRERAPRQKLAINLACVMNPDFALVHIALGQGYFASEGLEVKLTSFAIGKPALAAVLNGEADIATAAETPVMFAMLGGAKIKIPAVIATSGTNMAVVANRVAGVEKPGDLAGKSIGVTKGTAAEYFLDSFLVAHSIVEARVRVLDMQPGELLQALESGKIAAAVLWNPLVFQARAALAQKGIVFFGENIYTEAICIAADADFAKKNPEALKGFIRGLLRADDFARDNPEKALALVARYTAIDEASLRPMMELFRFRVSLDQSLLLVLEDESRWAMALHPDLYSKMPNFLEYIYTDALSAAAPDRVRLIR